MSGLAQPFSLTDRFANHDSRLFGMGFHFHRPRHAVGPRILARLPPLDVAALTCSVPCFRDTAVVVAHKDRVWAREKNCIFVGGIIILLVLYQWGSPRHAWRSARQDSKRANAQVFRRRAGFLLASRVAPRDHKQRGTDGGGAVPPHMSLESTWRTINTTMPAGGRGNRHRGGVYPREAAGLQRLGRRPPSQLPTGRWKRWRQARWRLAGGVEAADGGTGCKCCAGQCGWG